VVEKIKDDELVVENKELIIELITYVIASNRIVGFKAAVPNQNPEEPDFLEHWNEELQWQFFNLDQAEAALNKAQPSNES
jgi:hypothetical protein